MCGWEEGITILTRLKPVTSGFEVIKKIMLCMCLVNKGKSYFSQNYCFSELRNIWDYQQNLITMVTRLCNQLQLLPEFSAIDLKLSTDVTDILTMCMRLSEGKNYCFIP